MIDTNTLNEFLGIIKEPANQNANGFKSIMKVCSFVDLMITELWERGEIGDNEKINLRINLNTAREKMITLHRSVMKQTIKSSNFNDVDTLIDFIYGSIF